MIKNFIDPEAEFLFVEKDRVLEIAALENAVPYDVPGVELGHHQGKAIAEGFGSLGFPNDLELNRAEWIVYDALYQYCKALNSK